MCGHHHHLVSFPDPLAIETFQVRRGTCLIIIILTVINIPIVAPITTFIVIREAVKNYLADFFR